jgi:biotin carboxylase
LLREARVVSVIGSHPVASTPYLQVCDEAIAEPACDGEAFVAAALTICKDHRIDVFVPGREREAVAAALPEFAAAGVRVQVSPAEAIETLATKGSGYERAAKLGVEIPAYELVEDVAGYRAACERLEAAGLPICIKPDLDHGGQGFRVLDAGAQSLSSLAEPPSVRVAPAVVDLLLATIESFDPLVVSEFLPGAELSIDCLSSPDGELLVALPRSKGGLEWTRELVADPRAQEIARLMVEGCGLRYLSNVQVKYALDERRGPVLLEVNTRAASGLYQSCRASGVNLPALALALALGEDVTIAEPSYGKTMIVYNEAIPYQRVS